jgi:hypothetical protein
MRRVRQQEIHRGNAKRSQVSVHLGAGCAWIDHAEHFQSKTAFRHALKTIDDPLVRSLFEMINARPIVYFGRAVYANGMDPAADAKCRSFPVMSHAPTPHPQNSPVRGVQVVHAPSNWPSVGLFGPTNAREFGFRFGPHIAIQALGNMEKIRESQVFAALESIVEDSNQAIIHVI